METSKRLVSPLTLYQQAIDLFRKHASIIIPLSVLPALLDVYSVVANYGTEDLTRSGSGVTMLIGAVYYLLLTAAIAYLVSGKPSREAINTAFKKFFPMLLVGILTALAVIAGFILLVVPGVVFMVWTSQAMLVVLFEDKNGGLAISRSKELVKGWFWEVLGRILFITLPFILLGIISVFGLTMNIIGSLLTSLVLMPITLIYDYLLYKDLVAKR